jgi:hypothetical protein
MDARDEFIYKTDLALRVKQACTRHHIAYPRMLSMETAALGDE